jgi:hypothetical protein
MWPILVRNLVGTWIICGFWDWILYFSPLKTALHEFKVFYQCNGTHHYDTWQKGILDHDSEYDDIQYNLMS